MTNKKSRDGAEHINVEFQVIRSGNLGKGSTCTVGYDSIRVSPGISVTNVHYLYEEAVRAGSNHALVIADINLM